MPRYIAPLQREIDANNNIEATEESGAEEANIAVEA